MTQVRSTNDNIGIDHETDILDQFEILVLHYLFSSVRIVMVVCNSRYNHYEGNYK